MAYGLPEATAQTLPVPNPSFEEGNTVPLHWTLSGGEGGCQEVEGATGKKAIVLKGTGEDSTFWRSENLPLEPSTLYRLRFRGRTLGDRDGVGLSGPVFCNRDLGTLKPDVWKDYTSYFLTPKSLTPDMAWVRFGQWHKNGTVVFDAIDVVKALPLYTQPAGIPLGDGERVEGNRYTFAAPLASSISNFSRPVVHVNCGFNTNRLVFSGKEELVYRHVLAGRTQQDARLNLSMIHCEAGILAVDVSKDGTTWQELGTQAEAGQKKFALPAALFPADMIWVRLRNKTDAQQQPGSFQLETYEYTATLDGTPFNAIGETRFLSIPNADPRYTVAVESVGDTALDTDLVLKATITNTTPKTFTVPYEITVRRGGEETSCAKGKLELKPGSNPVILPYAFPGLGSIEMRLRMGKSPEFVAEWTLSVPVLNAKNYGATLPASNDQVGLWWASSGWKINRSRSLPQQKSAAAVLSMAGNETEALQIVLRPANTLKGLTVQCGALKSASGAALAAEQIEVLREHYVNVLSPTDTSAVAGWWPDPLPSLKDPITLEAHTNQPLWVRVHVPKGTPAGTYAGSIQLKAEGYSAEVPLQVVVYGFELPDRMTCTSAFGFTPSEVFKYHRLTDPAQQREVLDKYFASFAAHHISPYDPAPLDPFKVTWPQTGEAAQLKPTVDWTAWDAAMKKASEVYHFNSYKLPSPGLGGGTFYSRTEPEMLGFKENTPEYQAAFTGYYRTVQEHLREIGWLDKTYVYWFDEPDPKDYAFVLNGFRKLKEAAPEIARMLTEQVEPELVGGPNLWCPVSDAYKQDAAEAQRAKGDQFWWYVCCGPRAPFATEFIDHAGTEMRVWLWQTWQRKINGILIWATNYWNSKEAYPDTLQNPYEDPMSWQTGYGLTAGTRKSWGNGDGRFLYPPEAAAAGQSPGPVLEGPVDCIRWEMLRDGIEDYEYMAILKRLLAQPNRSLSSQDRAKYEALLKVPEAITKDMITFTIDPAPIEKHRDAVAKAIEKLTKRS